uniref:DUF5899 domain-containing protein n=1 Tax=viral metagenome TaxID=1070528 RepID=A0A6C0LEF4_9ZZZZ
MLPISAIVGVSTVGYLLDKIFSESEFNENNQYNEIPVENINGCANQYPWNFVDSFENIAMNNKSNSSNGSNGSNGNYQQKLNPENIEPSPLNPQYIMSPSNITAVNNAGNPPPEYFINATNRPVDDFVINNMVPFFKGTSTNQDMRGTGVAQANVKSEDLNLGNDYITPYNTRLSTFVGGDDTYLHKREAPNFFSPLERRDRSTIPGEGAPAQRPLRDRFTTSLLTKNDEAPFERQLVGPGINVDADLPNDGQGYNSSISTQIKPNNVNAYRLTQLPGRIAGTKYQASNLPQALPGTGPSFESFKNSKTNDHAWDSNNGMIDSQKLINEGSMYGVPSKKNPILLDLERRPLTATPAVTQAPMHYSDYVFPSNTNRRTVTNISFGQSVEIK